MCKIRGINLRFTLFVLSLRQNNTYTMKTRILLLAVVLAGISHCVSADDYSTLYVLPAEVSQPVEEIALADISSFTFSGGKMHVTMSNSSVKDIALVDIHKLIFQLPTTVSLPEATASGQCEVFTLSGQKVASGNKADALRQLPKGIYVVKDGHNVVKVTKR